VNSRSAVYLYRRYGYSLDVISLGAIAKFRGVILENHTDVWGRQYQNVRQEGAARIESEEGSTERATSHESAAGEDVCKLPHPAGTKLLKVFLAYYDKT
jgi:hypothetical protein